MHKLTFIKLTVIPVLFALTACEQMPGTREQQGAVIGGAAGAATGAAIAKDNRLLGALIGGALGAGGGYVIAAKTDKIESNDQDAAAKAARKSQENPATAEDARKAMTADLNMDGFVTLDEVVALKQAGFTDDQIVQKLRATDQVFELTQSQEQYLAQRGFSPALVGQIKQVNADKARALSKPAGSPTATTPSATPAPAPIITQPAPR